MRRTGPVVTLLVVTALAACSSTPPAQTVSPSPRGTLAPSTTLDATSPETTATAGEATATPEALPTVELGPLPPPLPVEGGTPRERAERIVAAIRSEGGGALPAIVSAFLASGIPVIGDDGTAIASDTAEEGLAVEAWELKVLADLDAANGPGAVLSDLGDVIAASDPALGDSPVPIGDVLLGALQEATTDSDPVVATAAAIIAELSRQRDGSEILAATSASDVTLDGLQVQLILHRLANDLLVEGTQGMPEGGTVRLAAARPETDIRAPVYAAAEPCRLSSSDKKVVWAAEQYLTRAIRGVRVFDVRAKGILDMFREAASGDLTAAQKYTRFLRFAGMFADVAKFFAAFLMLKVEIQMEGGEPLIRTKGAQPGEQRTLVAAARFDPGNLQVLNCFRLFFATAGVTFSVPQAEPLAERPVTWHGLEGFRGRLVQFRGNPLQQRTDASGRSRMNVEGVPHRPPVPAGAVAVEKRASVRFDIALKDTTLGGNLMDAVLGVALSGPVAPIRAALETLYRITLPAKTYIFAVRDWDVPDYRVDKTVTGSFGNTAQPLTWSIRYTGTKCDGPVGEWVIDSAGPLSGGGGTGTITGTIFVQIREGSLAGQMAGTVRGRNTEGLFGGTGRFDPQSQQLVLTVTSGRGNSYNFGFLDTGIMGPGTLTLPVEAGDFCE